LKRNVISIKNILDSKKSSNNYEKDFFSYLDDDLNMPQAMSVLWAVVRDSGLGNKEKFSLLLEFDKVLGLDLKILKKKKSN